MFLTITCKLRQTKVKEQNQFWDVHVSTNGWKYKWKRVTLEHPRLVAAGG